MILSTLFKIQNEKFQLKIITAIKGKNTHILIIKNLLKKQIIISKSDEKSIFKLRKNS